MLTMQEYIKGMDKDYYTESWKNMTAREQLEKYLYYILNLDFGDDFFKVETIEECINNNKKSLDNPEFKDIKNIILDTIGELEKYNDKGLFCKFVMDVDSCLLGQCYVVFTEKYEYINYISVI
ncbi:hypothetical protein [Clostridium sp. UBA4395]|uniref:hypothetical protein n=1 Tax=Clostridium sp. UBA4395 TaxID=1946360 RepID=UPI003216599E